VTIGARVAQSEVVDAVSQSRAIVRWPSVGQLLAVVLGCGAGVFLWRSGTLYRLSDYLIAEKDAWATAQSIVTILGICAAAWWWSARRARYPRADLKLAVCHRRLDENTTWLRVRATLANKGEARIKVKGVRVYVQRIFPLNSWIVSALAKGEPIVSSKDGLIPWRLIAESNALRSQCEIEPGESENLAWDFAINGGHRVVQAYVHFANEVKRNRGPIGWSDSVLYDIVDTSEPGSNGAPTVITHTRSELVSAADEAPPISLATPPVSRDDKLSGLDTDTKRQDQTDPMPRPKEDDDPPKKAS